MIRAEFYSVHKDFAQDGQNSTIYGHEEFLGLGYDAAMTKFHEFLTAAYASSDPWTQVFVTDDRGARIEWEEIDRRVAPEPTED